MTELKFNLGDQVTVKFAKKDIRDGTINAILPDPKAGGKPQLNPNVYYVPVHLNYSPNSFFMDDGTLINEPAYFVQGEHWYSWLTADQIQPKAIQMNLFD